MQTPTLTREEIHQKVQAEKVLVKGIKILRQVLTAEEMATCLKIAYKDDKKGLHLLIEELV